MRKTILAAVTVVILSSLAGNRLGACCAKWLKPKRVTGCSASAMTVPCQGARVDPGDVYLSQGYWFCTRHPSQSTGSYIGPATQEVAYANRQNYVNIGWLVGDVFYSQGNFYNPCY